MTELEITFHNEAEIRVQARIFLGRTLVSTSVTGPGETCILPAEAEDYDIYLKNAATGWEIARKLNSVATTATLKQRNGRYVIA